MHHHVTVHNHIVSPVTVSIIFIFYKLVHFMLQDLEIFTVMKIEIMVFCVMTFQRAISL